MGTGTTITLPAPHTLTVVAAQTLTTSTLTLLRVVDRASDSTVIAFLKELNQPLILWNESTTPTYTEIGDWTQAQANARIQVLIEAM